MNTNTPTPALINLTREEYTWLDAAKEFLEGANRLYQTPTEARLHWERLADCGPILLEQLYKIIQDRLPSSDNRSDVLPERQAADYLNMMLNHPSGKPIERRIYLETAQHYIYEALQQLDGEGEAA